MDLADAADELYALPADEFTKARDAAAKQSRADDRELATAIGKLKRPTASAWLVNQLARRNADRLEELLDLGDQLREAQDALDGDDLRRLNRERHQLVHALAESVRDFGAPVTDQVAREVEGTLDAALSDAAAGDAVRAGRLVRALAAGGFDGVDLEGAVAVPDAKPVARARTGSKPSRTASLPKKPTRDDGAARRRAEQERKQAATEVQRLHRELEHADASVEKARTQVAEARDRIAALEQELADAKATRADAERELEQAQRERTATAREHRNAQKALDKLG